VTGPRAVRLSTAPGRWVLFATVLGSGMALLDSTVVNVALPAIARDLDASMAGLQWIVNAYTLTLAGFILLGGSLGDRYGRRRVFVTGVVWFAIASALCGLARDIPELVAARALQGAGGALLTPGSLAIIQASFDPRDRTRAIGAWSGLGGIAGAAGPFVGGWLVAGPGWRWVFLLNLPLAAAVAVVAVRHVPETGGEETRDRFDVLGAALAALALAGMVYALTEAPAGGRMAGPVAAALLGVAAGAGFVLVERARSAGRGPRPMLPLEIFRPGQFLAVNVITFVMYAGMGVQFFLLVVHLQVVAGFSPMASGAALLPVTGLLLVLSTRSGALAQRIGPRFPMTGGLVMAACGMFLLSRVGPHASYARDVLPAVLLFALGLTCVVAPLTATVLATADARRAGLASGVNNAVARAAGLLAVAAVPPLSGLTGDAYASPARFAAGFRTAMMSSAALLLVGAVLCVRTIRDDVLSAMPEETGPRGGSGHAVPGPPVEPGLPPA
jgi:EmrB/QacA subfamily drug resistance transporter